MNLKPFQAESVSAILSGQTTLVAAPTGAGKTIITEKVMAEKKTILILPLIELIKQQEQRLSRSPFLEGRRIHAFHSQLSKSAQSEVKRVLIENAWDGLVLTPEFVQNNPGIIDQADIVFLDEAHAGINGGWYRGAFWSLMGLLYSASKQVVLMTGTITILGEKTLMQHMLGREEWTTIKEPIERPNLHMLTVEGGSERQCMIACLQDMKQRAEANDGAPPKGQIIICRTKTQVGWFAQFIKHYATYVTGESSKKERLTATEAMSRGDLVIGTSLIGTGLDFPTTNHVDVVGSFDLSSCIQFMGRAGRASQESEAILYWWPGMCQVNQGIRDAGGDVGQVLKANPTLYRVAYPHKATSALIDLAYEECEGLERFCLAPNKEGFIKEWYK